jgi:hypothetical protein
MKLYKKNVHSLFNFEFSTIRVLFVVFLEVSSVSSGVVVPLEKQNNRNNTFEGKNFTYVFEFVATFLYTLARKANKSAYFTGAGMDIEREHLACT